MMTEKKINTESDNFQEYLSKLFGKRIDSFSRKRDDGIHLSIDAMNSESIEIESIDKCIRCPAKVYRQDLPFWLGSHLSNQAMVIAQDPGKGKEENGINCVFSLQVAAHNLEKYKQTGKSHEHYLRLFSNMFGEDFLHKTYFTDIVKCAYSTEPSVRLSNCHCRVDIFKEISMISPKVIVLLGSAARDTFIKLAKKKREHKLNFVDGAKVSYNKKNSIGFSEYLLNEETSVFFIPHFAGNLFVGKEYHKGVEKFESKVCNKINEKFRLLTKTN